MLNLGTNKTFFVDVDDTLILWDISEHPKSSRIAVDRGKRGKVFVVPHRKNINLMKKFYKLGYDIIVWSGSGADWAETIIKALGLQKLVVAVMDKPHYYLDDVPLEAQMRRIWRDTKTGKDAARCYDSAAQKD